MRLARVLDEESRRRGPCAPRLGLVQPGSLTWGTMTALTPPRLEWCSNDNDDKQKRISAPIIQRGEL